MARLSERYISDIYQEFKNLRGSELHEIIRFYEENKSEIYSLELHEFFELQVTYLSTLFQFNEFEKFLSLVDEAIEASIIHNIIYVNHENIYNKLLLMKGEANHFVMEYDKAIYIFEELIKMDPYKDKYFAAIARTKSKLIPNYLKNIRALSIVFFILSAITIGIEVLVIKSLFNDWIQITEICRNTLFGLGWLVLLLGELIHFWKVEKYIRKTKMFYRNLKSSKR